MKASTIVYSCLSCIWLGIAIGCAINPQPTTVSAQATTLSGCTVAGGASTPCAQYVVQVDSARGLNGFVIYSVQSGPLDTSQMAQVASGSHAATWTDTEPQPRQTIPFTITATE